MTYLQIRQRIAEQLGVSSTDTTADDNDTMSAKIKAWVNNRYKLVAASRSWNWLIKDSIIQTVTDITTGTITATNASANITFTSGPAASVAGYFIQFSDSSDWYEISTHVAAATTAVLTVPYLGTTSSTLTYTLRKIYYALPTDTGKILNVSQHRVLNSTLTYVPPRILDNYLPLRLQVSTPRYYTIAGVDSSRQYKMEIFPSPNVAMNLNVRRYRVITELSADGDFPIMPEAYHEFLVWDVLGTYGFSFLDDTRINSAKAEANRIYKDMKDNDVATENIAVRMPYDVDMSDTNILNQFDLPIQ